mmetsp:Transcript_1947/g.4368  ORF Transcript_1947/g.4368 Transcript_1947/m.4368 type:complete len:340 (-) Transcript_1947:20-1039(-)
MKSVLCLIVDDALRSIQHLSRLLLSSHSWKTVHENGPLVRQLHRLCGDLEGHEGLESLLPLVLGDPVAHPRIAVDDVGACYSLVPAVADLERSSLVGLQQFLALLHHTPLDVESLVCRPRNGHVESHDAAQTHQIVSHVVLAVADECELHSLVRAVMLDDGEKVGEHLAWMTIVVEGIDDGNGGVLSEFFDRLSCLESSCHHIHISRHHLGCVKDGLLLSQGRVSERVVDAVTSELSHPGLERHSRSQGGLLKEREEGPVLEGRRVGVRVSLHVLGKFHHFQDLLSGQVSNMLHMHRIIRRLGSIPHLLGARAWRLEASGRSRGEGQGILQCRVDRPES